MADPTALPPLTPAASQDSGTQASALPELPTAPIANPGGQLPTLPAAPGATSGALPDLPTAQTADQAAAKTKNILDILQDHGHIMDDLEQNAVASFHQQYDPLKKAVTGAGSFFGTNPEEKDLPGTENESWVKRKAAIANQLSTKPVLNLNDLITPEERAANPHLAAIADPAAQAITALTTPRSLAFMGGLGIAESLPKFIEKELAVYGVSTAAAAKAAKVAQTGLSAMGAYFSADQIATAVEKVPEIAQAILRGEYDKAIGLTTAATINGVIGYDSAKSTWHSLHSILPESTSAKAMSHSDYAEAVKEDQLTKQIGGARSQQLADLGRKSVADQLTREQITEYVEAHGNRDIMAQRQKETANPVTPAQRIEDQGGLGSLEDETKPAAEASKTEQTPPVPSTKTPQEIVEQAGGIFRGAKDGLVEITLPEHMTANLEMNPALKKFVSVTLPEGEVTPAAVRAAMDRKVEEFGGKPADPLPASLQKEIDENPSFITKAAAHKFGLIDEENAPKEAEKAPLLTEASAISAQKPATGTPTTWTSPEAEKAQGLFSDEAKANAQKPGDAQAIHWMSPAAQQSAEVATAVARYEELARAHVITPEERDLMVKQQDPNFKLTDKQEKDLAFARAKVFELGQRAQKAGLLAPAQLRKDYVPREWDFEQGSDPTKATVFDSHHEGQMHGLVSKNKDYYALVSDYTRKMTNRIANSELITRLKTGRTNDGSPLAVGGGYVEGQRVSTEGPQSHIMGDNEILKLKSEGKFTKLIESGRIVANPDKSFTMKTDDYVPAKNLFEVRPIGPTPIPPEIVKEMQADGTLDKLAKKNLIYQNEKGEWLNKSQLYARVPVYVHPEIAEHMNEVVRAKEAQPTTAFGRVLKGYDDVSGKMKNLLLSFSPFHKATESWRMMESLGLLKGGALAAKTNIASLPGGEAFLEKTGIGLPPKIDYFNLTPMQEAAIRDGIVVTDPRGNGPNLVEEGLSGGAQNLGYKAIDKTLGAGLEATAKKMGFSPEDAAAVRRNVNLQKILTDDVFGPHGMISSAKFELYAQKKPLIADQIKSDHPSWTPEEVDSQAGKIAAQWANNKFGGLNYTLLGRALSTQRVLRRVLLAPDFLESTGRSVADVAKPYGSNMMANLIRFNIAHMLTAAGINMFLHHDENSNSPSGWLKSSHILDHPFGVVSGDNKSVYGLRTTATDFIHLLTAPREFLYNRVAPPLRAAVESYTQRNEYGRKESLGEALKSIPKATLPIQIQGPLGLGPNTTTEPSARDQFLKSIGIQARPNRSSAEQLAIDKVSAHLQGTEARTGQDLVRSQLRFNAEDNLREALAAQKAAKETGADPAQAKARVDAAKHAIDTLADQKIINPIQKKSVMLAAQAPRLVSIFNSLDPKDALEVWDKATDEERVALSPYMQQKYGRWREKMAKEGQNISQLNQDDQAVQDHFTQARIQANDALRKPLPVLQTAKTKSPTSRSAEKTSEPATEELPELKPAAVLSKGETEFIPFINDAARKYSVDPTLIEAVMHRESLGNPQAKSKKGALGLMQLEPATAKEYGVTDIKDPEQNIDAGVHYMADLLKKYDGDEQKALAAYNAGPKAVQQYNGVPPFKETKEYVKAVQDHKGSNYQNSKEFKPTTSDERMFESWPKSGPSTAPGMVKAGNIDLTKRPIVHRANGEVSSLYSASFGTPDGEVLVPLISQDGKVLSIEEAKKQYAKDGKSLGVFKTPAAADEFANFLHEHQGKFQVWTNGGQYRPSVETYSDK